MIYIKAIVISAIVLANSATVEAGLRGEKMSDETTGKADYKTSSTTDEMHRTLRATRKLKTAVGGVKGAKQNKTANPNRSDTGGGGAVDPSNPPTATPSTAVALIPTSPPTFQPTGPPTTHPTSKPSAAPAPFDPTIVVKCQPDGTTALTPNEFTAKTIICDANKPSCRKAVTAVKEYKPLQNFFACAGNLGEGAARKLFNNYASNDMLAEQLTIIAATKQVLVTERPNAMKAACMAIGMAQSPPITNPCCQGASGCTSITASATNPPPFMTIAITACTGDGACKEMGPNPLILDSSCTGVSACESVNTNNINPFVTGVTFIGDGACTTARSCEGVGHRSYGDVTIQHGACIGSEACNGAGRRTLQKSSVLIRSHIDIGMNACVGIYACKNSHGTVDHRRGGKVEGSLTIGDRGCSRDRSCEMMGFNDMMRTDLVVPPGGCGSVDSCRGCMTKTECDSDEVYIISDVDGACPKGGRDTNNNPTGDMVDKYCVDKATLPTDCPTFSPTPLPTISSQPTRIPTSMPTDKPSTSPTRSQSPTGTPGFEVGCLNGPGNVTSTFNTISGKILCDVGEGPCANFLASLDALADDKELMIKSIFGCDGSDPPAAVSLQVAQKRFDKIKDSESVMLALLEAVSGSKKLYTGSGTVVTAACNGSCCTGNDDCSTSPSTGVMTVTTGSCKGGQSCERLYPDTIIIESCARRYGCTGFGTIETLPSDKFEVGYRVIGPRACTAYGSCNDVGLNVLGSLRFEKGSCDSYGSCSALAARSSQSNTNTPVVANVFVGEDACQDQHTCVSLHARGGGFKVHGNLIIEKGACQGNAVCNGLASGPLPVSNVVIKAGVCLYDNGDYQYCAGCINGGVCNGSTEATYTIANATEDCSASGPTLDACTFPVP